MVEGKKALYAEDFQEVFGSALEEEADEAFAALDQDGNSNITLDEMVIKVVEIVLLLHSLMIFNHDFLERTCYISQFAEHFVFVNILCRWQCTLP